MSGNPAYNALQHDVCVGLGLCGGTVNGMPCHVDDFIPEVGPVSADQFVDWLLLAEGMDSSKEHTERRELLAALRAAFIRHMGAEVVDASALKWDVD